MKKYDNHDITFVISGVISFFLAIMVLEQESSSSQKKLDLLVLMLGTYIMVYTIVVIIRFLISIITKNKQKKLINNYNLKKHKKSH